jgi:hypothetical protein
VQGNPTTTETPDVALLPPPRRQDAATAHDVEVPIFCGKQVRAFENGIPFIFSVRDEGELKVVVVDREFITGYG